MSLIHTLSHTLRSKAWIGILGPAFLLVVLVGCGGPNLVAVPTPAPTLPISSFQFTTFDLKLPPEALNAPVVGPLPDNTPMHILIAFKVNQTLLNQLNKQKVKPGQSQNLEAFANQLGISDATYQKIQQLFSISNASLKLGKLHTDLSVDTTAKSAALLFQTSFVLHKLKGRTFYAPISNPKVPTFIASSIVAITGLDTYSAPVSIGLSGRSQHFKTLRTQHHPAVDCNPAFSAPVSTSSDVAHAYGYDQLWKQGFHGENITVNLIEIEGFNQDDVQAYGQCVNFQGQLKVTDVGTPPDPAKAEGEAALDIEMLMGLAPSVNIVDYEADGPSRFLDALQKLIDDNAQNSPSGSIVSISMQAAENQQTSNFINAVDQALQQLTQAENMTVFVASGDCGAFADRTFGDLSVNFLASDPNVVAVGGTKLSVDGNQNRSSEVVWSDGSDHSSCTNQWGSGGGNSIFWKRPDWQTGTGVDNQYSNGARQLPDVSAVAFHLPVYFQGRWIAVDGTSAATPIWAAGLALVNDGLIQQANRFFSGPPTFYAVANNSNGASSYYDVTRGDNLHYPATPGWDFATGLGSPNLPDFYKTLLAMAQQS